MNGVSRLATPVLQAVEADGTAWDDPSGDQLHDLPARRATGAGPGGGDALSTVATGPVSRN
ncbi:hypothetical protein [Streptomyces sp. JH34]|uniref:hypothetical protein n=1 Tax=Streptomyces sp. JH34 TaxID=2793633 RepID=UPI0023F70AD0|nr:hypothetical protein [Streptomyces sp. JH34]MDF6022392.1 hypothetical protein [Streptomyces sp. JH34]